MDLKQLAKIPVVAQELAAIRKDSRRLKKAIAGHPPCIIPPFRNPTKTIDGAAKMADWTERYRLNSIAARSQRSPR
jgi:hypothetical protein